MVFCYGRCLLYQARETLPALCLSRKMFSVDEGGGVPTNWTAKTVSVGEGTAPAPYQTEQKTVLAGMRSPSIKLKRRLQRELPLTANVRISD